MCIYIHTYIHAINSLVGVVPPGRARSMFLAVGCWDDTVQLLSLDPSDVLGKGPAFSVESRPTSLCLVEMLRDTSAPAQDSSSRSRNSCMYACYVCMIMVVCCVDLLMSVCVSRIFISGINICMYVCLC